MFPQDSLKNWHKGKGSWSNVDDSLWFDWKWQMRNRLSTVSDFQQYLNLTQDEISGFKAAVGKLSVSVTPYFFNLIDKTNPNCPIRRQVVPLGGESNVSPEEMIDPVGEDETMPVPGIVHRYPDRVLFLVTDRCASYCRYCTRSRMVSNAQGYGFSPSLFAGLEYIRNNESIRDVLISGGDPLLLSDSKLKQLLVNLSDIKHIEFVRIGTRIPVFLPQRINDSLLDALSSHPNLWMSIHVNHPAECTLELKDACKKLVNSGIPLGNQSVLLKGINDSSRCMQQLIHRLLMMKVRPYYLYQCDLVRGSSHLRADVKKGVEIIQQLRGNTTGYAIPQFVIDAPKGGGKVPINPNYIEEWNNSEIIFKNFEGDLFSYPI
jgi:lysine 2,3-aminomutase